MKIALAQTNPVKGNIAANIDAHSRLIKVAIASKADFIVFPELSLTGYEPMLAKDLAIEINDSRLDVFQQLSNAGKITIGVGVPTRASQGTHISLILFQPNQTRKVNSKQYLHPDEDPFFVSGNNAALTVAGENIALAICYEISVPDHTEAAFQNSPSIYVASVVKFPRSIDKAYETLSATAKRYGAVVLMSNGVGVCDGEICGGKSAAWNSKGELIAHLNDSSEGLLMVDTKSLSTEVQTFKELVNQQS